MVGVCYDRSVSPWFKMPARVETMQRARSEDACQAFAGARCALTLLAHEVGLRPEERELVETSLAQISRAERVLSRVHP